MRRVDVILPTLELHFAAETERRQVANELSVEPYRWQGFRVALAGRQPVQLAEMIDGPKR